MKPAVFTFHRPATVDDALKLLNRFEDAKVLAGGQSLLPIMNMRLALPEHLIDITGIAELRQYAEDDSGVRYGAITTHMMIEDGLVPDPTRGLLQRAAADLAYRAIRNRGTVAGSLAHSDSSAEWPTIMSALDAAVEVASTRNRRRIPVRELLLGFFATALEDDELITSVEVPRLATPTRWGLYKMSRKPGEFAESLAVALVRPGGPELWVGAARDVPVQLPRTEELVSAETDPVTVEELVGAVGADTASDGHARQLHAVAVHRALKAAQREEAHV